MPSKPEFDDAVFVLRILFNSLQNKVRPENCAAESELEIARPMLMGIGLLGHVLADVVENGDLPTNEERRKKRLFDIYRESAATFHSKMLHDSMVRVVEDTKQN